MSTRTLSRPAPRLVAPACDRTGVWRGEPAPCPVLAPAGEPLQLQGMGPWDGPLLVLADRDTGSASEDFVAWLRINGIARVLGEPTAGAGCGYVNGGARSQFRASRFDVRMPNCARFLPDGRNEIEGIPPDVALPMSAEDDDARAKALQAALAAR
jgi:C-terminal processing protease CtpA/Prc